MLGCEGHYARYTALKAQAMSDSGLEVTIVGFPERYDLVTTQKRLQYISVFKTLSPSKRIQADKWRLRLGNYWTFIVEIFLVHKFAFKYARQHQYDILFFSEIIPWLILPNLISARLSKRSIPVAGYLHSYYYNNFASSRQNIHSRIQERINKTSVRFLPFFMNLICDGDFIRQHLFKDKRHKIHIIPNGFEPVLKNFLKFEARQKLGLPLNRRILLLFGVASAEKGAGLLFQALQKMEPLFDVCVVGKTGGVYMQSWGNDILAGSSWEKHLHVVERYITDEERCLYYSACDGVILPYRYGFIVSSGSMNDAIAFGKAVIVSDQFEIGRLTKLRRLGLTFTPESVSDLHRVLEEFASKPQAWYDAITERGKQMAADYSITRMGELYRKLFEELQQRDYSPNHNPK